MEVVSLSELWRYRLLHEFVVKRVGERHIETPHGPARLIIFENGLDKSTHPVLVIGDLSTEENPVARIHSQCLTGDAFHSLRWIAGQLNNALDYMHEQGNGALIYLRQEGGALDSPTK